MDLYQEINKKDVDDEHDVLGQVNTEQAQAEQCGAKMFVQDIKD